MKSINESQRIFVRFIDKCFNKLFYIKDGLEEVTQDLEFKANGKSNVQMTLTLDKIKPTIKIDVSSKISVDKDPLIFSLKFSKINKDPITCILADAEGDIMYIGYLRNENREDQHMEIKLITDKYNQSFITAVLSLASSIVADRMNKISSIINSYTDITLDELIKFTEDVDSYLLTTR